MTHYEVKPNEMSEKAFEYYSNSDWKVFVSGETFGIAMANESPKEIGTLKDISDMFEEFAKAEEDE